MTEATDINQIFNEDLDTLRIHSIEEISIAIITYTGFSNVIGEEKVTNLLASINFSLI